MDAASHCAWGKVEERWDNGLVGVLPYTIERRHFTTRIGMPWYSRVLGPWLMLPASKSLKRLTNASKIVTSLITKLPKHDEFRQCMAPETDESAAFVMAGYVTPEHYVQQNYTLRLAPGLDEKALLANMHWRTRSHIKACQKQLEIVQHEDVEQHLRLAEAQATDQGQRSWLRSDLIRRSFAAALAHGQATVLKAQDAQGEMMASAIVLWDGGALYFWQGARKVASGNYAYAYVLWEAMQFAHKRDLIFDFDGFYSPSAAKYLASFGGTPVARPWIIRQNARARSLSLARDLWEKSVVSQDDEE